MPALEFLASSGLGSLLGMRHAIEPDHLAAISTLVTAERSPYRAAWLGFCWGIGHTATLVLAGIGVIWLRGEIPPQAAWAFELLVAAMLVTLGVKAIARAAREEQEGPVVAHRHGGLVHRHHTAAAHVHVGTWTLARRPLLVGAVHGLAGSGALVALVPATLPTTASRIVYMALFGLGSAVGMAAMSGLLGWPLARWGAKRSFGRAVTFVVGCGTTVLGIAWGYLLLTELP
jgi:ABC-type nickel/cobalt efflux system permease component RcnA